MPPSPLLFRRLGRIDFRLLQRWMGRSHVADWWREPLDLAGLEAKYGPRIDGTEPTHVFMIEYGGRLVGWIQWYQWRDYPEHAAQLGADPESAGIDLAIGEEEMTGQGLGARIVGSFLDQIVFADLDLRGVITDPEQDNLRSVRALEKAGFRSVGTVRLRGEDFSRCVMKLTRTLPAPPAARSALQAC